MQIYLFFSFILMQGLLGVFFRIRCPALVEDLPINEEKWEEEGHSYSYIEGLYEQASNNCFIAAGLYGGTFLLSLVMWTVNKRSDYTMH